VSQSRKRSVVVLAALAAACGTFVVVVRPFASDGPAKRPELQRILHRLVAGPGRRAPGVTAYVIGPRGTWWGAAGVANVSTREKMSPSGRFRIESNSKAYVVAAALQLVREGKLRLDDTVERWFPGLLHTNGERITVHDLMTDASGLIDDNDLSTPQAIRKAIANIGDPELKAQVIDLAARVARGPVVYASPVTLIEVAGWQPLLFEPGTQYHHGNIGWNLAGMIVARAAGTSLAQVYRERIFEPLGLTQTAYDPQGPIRGEHVRGYQVLANGNAIDRTSDHAFKGADGAIVTNAKDEAIFLRGLWQGKVVAHDDLMAFYGMTTGRADCPGDAGEGMGTGSGFRSFTWAAPDGSRVAVLLLNGNRVDSGAVDAVAERASRQLYCAS
jgi:D-alanyl-D-alanine carboxypeptidase